MGSQEVAGSRGDKREAILKIAAEMFGETGYAATSMSMIAARLGGSKGTLYNYFKSKEALFEAHVLSRCAMISAAMFDWPEQQPGLLASLQRLGEHYVELVLGDELVGNFRQLIAEGQRAPALSRIFYDQGPAASRKRLAKLLDDAVAKGELPPLDSLQAAGEFFSLCRGGLWFERLLNIAPAPTKAEAKASAARAVAIFVKTYAAA